MPPLPRHVAPMLATPGPVPAAGAGEWVFEFKWDGVRAIAGATPDGRVRATSRNDKDFTASYPELVGLAELVDEPVLLDGELVVLDAQGRPSFGLLQSRMHVRAPSPALLRQAPVQFYVFDLLHADGRSLLGEPYRIRRQLLEELDLNSGPVRTPPSYTDLAGEQLLAIARDNGLEGVVAKRPNSRYEPGRRSRAWIKTPLRRTQEVIIGGWRPGEGRRAGLLGSLLLGAFDEAGRLAFVGGVGTGFTERMLRALTEELAPLERASSPFSEPVPREYARGAHWVEPVLVGEVEFREWSADGRLRHPSWRGRRPERRVDEVVVPKDLSR